MNHNAQQYLESQVMTATPQKLRLMLIDGAIRFAHQTVDLWQKQQNEAAFESLIRCRNIITELLSGIRPDQTDLTRKVAGVYLFLFRTLTEAQLKRDRQKIEEAVAVLEIERETWRLVCEKLPDAPFPMEQAGDAERHTTPIMAPSQAIGGPFESGFAFEA